MTWRWRVSLAIGLFSIALFLASLVLEQISSHPPCSLCTYVRWASLALGLSACSLARAIHKASNLARPLTWLCILFMLVGLGVSLFHSGLERGFIHRKMACTQSLPPPALLSREQLRQHLESNPHGRCDKISWSIGGLSLANINCFIFAILLMGFLYAQKRNRSNDS